MVNGAPLVVDVISWNGVESLLLNVEFYVALGTILMAMTTALSVYRQGRLSKILDLRERINVFYIPLFHTFTYPWDNDTDFQKAWNGVRPHIRTALCGTVDALYNGEIYGKTPRLHYLQGVSDNEKEYKAWYNFYREAWRDFNTLDKRLMRLEKNVRTDLPNEPDPPCFDLIQLSLPKEIQGHDTPLDSGQSDDK